MEFKAPVGIKNKFTIHVDDIVTGAHREYKAENIVLNAMYSRLVNFQSYFVNIHFGTGTGAFNDPTRTSLYTHLGTKSASTEFQTRELPTSQWRRKVVLNPEEFVGAEISEVGIAFGSTATNLVTHAALKDAEGNPIVTDPKASTEIITIYADVYFELGAIDAMYSGKIRWVQPLANNQLLSYLMGASYPTQQFRVTRAPEFSDGTAHASHGQSGNVGWTADAANKKRTTSVMRLGVSVGNGEVRGFGLGSSDALGTFRGQFPITGVNTGKAITETIGAGDGATTGFNLSWNDPQSLVVKVDDAAVDSGDYDAIPRTNLAEYSEVQWSGSYDGSLTDSTPLALVDANLSTSIRMHNGFVVSFDIGEALSVIPVDRFRVHVNASSSMNWQIRASNSPDFSSYETLATITSLEAEWNVFSFEPVTYRYYRIVVVTGSSIRNHAQIELLTADDQITFHTPPANGAVITADYTVDYVPKDEFHVLDLQATIQYGEIV